MTAVQMGSKSSKVNFHDLKSPRQGRAMVKDRKDRVGWERLTSHLEVQSYILNTFYIPAVFILVFYKLNIRLIPSIINLPFLVLCVSLVHTTTVFSKQIENIYEAPNNLSKERKTLQSRLSHLPTASTGSSAFT